MMQEQLTTDDVIRIYQAKVRSLVLRVLSRYGIPFSEKDDFISEAILGLLEAHQRYRPEFEKDFWAYALPRVRGAIIDVLRRNSELDRKSYRLLKEYNRCKDYVEQSRCLGKELTSLQKELLAKVMDHLSKGALLYRISSKNNSIWEEQQEVHSRNAEQLLIAKQRHQSLRKAIKRLTLQEQELLHRVYNQEQSIAEAGAALGYSRSWASRVHNKAVEKVRIQLMKQVRIIREAT